jgi:hypothetical protein
LNNDSTQLGVRQRDISVNIGDYFTGGTVTGLAGTYTVDAGGVITAVTYP